MNPIPESLAHQPWHDRKNHKRYEINSTSHRITISDVLLKRFTAAASIKVFKASLFSATAKPVYLTYRDTPREEIYRDSTFPYFRAPHIYISTAKRPK